MSKALQIKEFPDYYITDIGTIYTRRHGRIKKLKTELSKWGYYRIWWFVRSRKKNRCASYKYFNVLYWKKTHSRTI